MKAPRAMLVLAALFAISLVASAPAQARGHGGHGGYHGHARIHYGFYFGAPLYSPWYYPPPYYYPQTIVVPTSPPVYIERGDEQAAPQAQSWWYYCPESKTYYPYVKQCPGGWQKVAPQPPAQ
jgi:hypothetical protein